MQKMTLEILTFYTENTWHVNALVPWRIALIALTPKSKMLGTPQELHIQLKQWCP